MQQFLGQRHQYKGSQLGVQNATNNASAKATGSRQKRTQKLVAQVAQEDASQSSDVNIDELAQQLSQSANEMKAYEQDYSDVEWSRRSAEAEDEREQIQEDLEAECGPPSFLHTDISIEKVAGTMVFHAEALVSQSKQGEQVIPHTEDVSETPAIFVHVGRYSYTSLTGDQPSCGVFIKEYPPGTRGFARNEMKTYQQLHDSPLPGDELFGALETPNFDRPLLKLAGYYCGPCTDTAIQAYGQDLQYQSSIFLVFPLWQVRSLDKYLYTKQMPFYPWGWQQPGKIALNTKGAMLRKLCQEAVSTLDYLHSRGVIHQALSSNSFLATNLNDNYSNLTRLMLHGFCLSQCHDQQHLGAFKEAGVKFHADDKETSSTHDMERPADEYYRGVQEDCQALAVILAEIIFSSLSNSGPSVVTSRKSLHKLTHLVFKKDVKAFREYCRQEEDWKYVVEFLDGKNLEGWNFLDVLLNKPLQCPGLKNSSFVMQR